MKIKEQTIQSLEYLSAAELMLVCEWIERLRVQVNHAETYPSQWKISDEQIHEAMRKCHGNLSNDILELRDERI